MAATEILSMAFADMKRAWDFKTMYSVYLQWGCVFVCAYACTEAFGWVFT